MDENLGISSAISFMTDGKALIASSKQALIYKVDAETGRVYDKTVIADNNAKTMTFTTLEVLSHHSPVVLTRDHNGFNLINLRTHYI